MPEPDFERLLASEKMRAMKELAYGAGHEINNPLANIATRAQSLLRDESDPERRRKLASINSQAFRAHEMIADLMLFAKPPELDRQSTNLAEIVDTLFEELQEEANKREVVFARLGNADCLAWVDPIQIAVALKGMLYNSLEAIGHTGRIEVELLRPENSKDVTIVVRDNGPGISKEIMPHIFDPFFSGREAGRGLGFGLTKAWRIVDDHKGSLLVDSPSTGGAIFSILLPNARHQEEPPITKNDEPA